MKFRATFKMPGAADHEGFLEQATRKACARFGFDYPDELQEAVEEDEFNDVCNDLAHGMAAFAEGWVDDGEYVVLEFDDEAGTCVVLPSGPPRIRKESL